MHMYPLRSCFDTSYCAHVRVYMYHVVSYEALRAVSTACTLHTEKLTRGKAVAMSSRGPSTSSFSMLCTATSVSNHDIDAPMQTGTK